MAIGSALTAAATFGGAWLTNRGQNRASDQAAQANSESLAFAREQAEEERRRYEDEQMRLDAAWAAEQARRAPFRDAALSILGSYGFETPDSAYQTRPAEWAPGAEGMMRDPASAQLDQGGFGGIQRRTPTTRETIAQMMARGR